MCVFICVLDRSLLVWSLLAFKPFFAALDRPRLGNDCVEASAGFAVVLQLEHINKDVKRGIVKVAEEVSDEPILFEAVKEIINKDISDDRAFKVS